ncbi:MAG: diacylglycerol kinase family protein [Rhodospirillaceae bacterium]|nr:diacylglycerol kinase family protein [Rhodospirillaceae bacterium]
MVLGPAIWLAARLGPARSAGGSPLAWRLGDPQAGSAAARPFSIRARLRSFVHAGAGVRFVLTTQHNVRIHLAAAVLAVAAGLALGISSADWRWIIAAIAWVWFAEAANTAIEHLCDVVCPGPHEGVRIAKDVAAGAVLISAIGAAILGIVTLWPYLAPWPGGAAADAAMCSVLG